LVIYQEKTNFTYSFSFDETAIEISFPLNTYHIIATVFAN